jgi:CheY-like chemotaxis protein
MDTRSLLVLLAEDDVSLRRLIAAQLEREGMRVVQVGDGRQLRDYLLSSHPHGEIPDPDVVVSDIDMPGMSGPEAIEASKNRRPAIILITARATAEVREAADRAGFSEVFEKPFPIRTLARTIRRLTQRPATTSAQPMVTGQVSTTA